MTLRLIPELPGAGRLGRHVEHDERSRAFAVAAAPVIASRHWTRHVPIYDQGNLGSCFPPGTHVRMADGSERPIEDVRLGERVVTAEGGVGRVVRTLLRDEDGGLMRLALWGHSHLRMTREHPVLTARGYVPASELRVGDEVALPRYLAGTVDAITPADHVTQVSHRVARGNRWTGVVGRRGLRVGSHVLPDKITLDENFGRLVGLFLAEGSCDSGKVTWSFHIAERDTLAAETAAILAKYGVEAHRRDVPAHNGHKVVVHGTAWARLLASLCGNGSGLKRLHPSLTAGPSDFLAAVLSGWLDGDGCHRKDGSREGITISPDLALGMYDIAQALGHHPVLVRSEPVMNAAAKTRRPRWTLTLAAGQGRCRQDDRHVWRKVREIRLEDYVGPVYDLTIEGDHSYVAEGVGVHNCTGNAMAGALCTGPFRHRFGEAGAVRIYKAATIIDGIPGTYPPDDTGSSGLAVAKVAQAKVYISRYDHGFSLADALAALQNGPAICGVNWYDSFDQPLPDGTCPLTPGASVRGGHEVCLVGVNVASHTLKFANSWSAAWGVSGYGVWSYDTFSRLLAEQGDVTVPVA